MSVDLLIAAFNAAETWQDALAAVKDTAYFEVLFEDPEVRAVYSEKLTDLPDDQGREQAIGMGIVQIKALFGDFTSVEDIAKAVKGQIDTEHAKFEFITALDAATTAAEMAAAIEATAGLVNEHRQALIDDFLASDDADVVALGNALKSTTFTKALAEIVKHFDDDAYMAEVGARMFAARNAAVPDGRFYGDGKATAALDSTMDAIDPVYAFNSATSWEEALAAVKNNTTALQLDQDALDKLDELPDNAGREKAIALGVLEYKVLFGPYTDLAGIKTAVEHQIDVEHAKFEFITALDGATTAAEMAAAIKGTVELVSQHRQDLIQAWSQSDLPAVVARANELAGSAFTKVLAEIVKHLDDEAYMAQVGQSMLAARGNLLDGQFYGDGKIIPALDAAMDAIDPVYAFNSATTADEMLAAIKAHYETLLDDTTDFDGIPDGSGRQKAVASGVVEIKTFFGDFASAEEATEALAHQASVEYNKYVFIQAIDNAADAAGIAAALVEYVGTLNDQRQDLIAEWGAVEGNAALAARVAELRADIYTKALKAVADRLGNEAFVAELAESLFEARSDVSGGRFNSIVTITNLMGEGVEAINVDPTAPGTKSITINEDTSSATVDIEAEDLDGDTLTYEVKATAKPQKGTVTFNDAAGTFTYKPAANVNGTDSFTIIVSDGNGGIVEQKVTVNITPVNDTPWNIDLSGNQIVENSKTGAEVGKLTGSDYDGDALTFTLLDNAGGRFVIDSNGSLRVTNDYALDFEQATSHTIKVQVKDSAGATYEESFTVSVTDDTNEKVTGTATADVITGGAGKDVLNGGLGNDELAGGLGNDTLTGGKGKDVFVFDSKLGTSSTDRKVNFDKITDFSVKDDSIYLDNAIFKKLGSGTEAKPKQLSKSFFTIGNKANDKNDYLIYNDKTGVLSYDADGSGKGKAIEIAQLSKKLAMTYKDFFVI